MKSENKPVDEDRLVGLIVSHSKIRLLVLPDKLKSETALEGGDDNEVVFTEKLAGSAAKELPSAKCDSSNSPKFTLLTIHATQFKLETMQLKIMHRTLLHQKVTKS